MAAIVIRENAKPTWPAGAIGARVRLRGIIRRAMDCAAAAVLACAVGAALLQLAAELVSFPAPIAVTAITVMAVALLNSLRRHLRRRRAGLPGELCPNTRTGRPAFKAERPVIAEAG